MKVIIVYKSETGFTETYAGFIAAALNGALVPFKDRRKIKPDPDAVLIFGAPVKAAALPGSRWFLRNRSRFKKAYAFAVGENRNARDWIFFICREASVGKK